MARKLTIVEDIDYIPIRLKYSTKSLNERLLTRQQSLKHK